MSLNNLTNGPAKLTQAMNITKKQYGEDLTISSTLHITEGIKAKKIGANPRIGIKNGTNMLWNFRIEI
jgi:DNA-3-methyladenine glycosylase